MQQIGRFIKILPSLYRLGEEAVYAWLQEEKADMAQEMTATEIYRYGGTFIYLRYPVESHQSLLVPLVERLLKRPQFLFLENNGNYFRHWKIWEWHVRDGRMEQSGILEICGFRIWIPRNCDIEMRDQGICFHKLCFGRKGTDECEGGFFSWDGRFRFLIHGGEFWKEAQIRYELDGYDSFTKRRLSVVCRTGEPRWSIDKCGAQKESGMRCGECVKDDSSGCIQADIFWNIQKRTSFINCGNMVMKITDFPVIRMDTLAFRFARGTEEYFLAPFGNGVFLADANVTMGSKGYFKVRSGDRIEMLIKGEGYLGARGLCAETSMLKIHAPLYAAGIEMEACTSVPVLPSGSDKGRKKVELLLDRKMREGCRLAYRRDVCFGVEEFETCICGRDILWYNLYGLERKVPGIALCRMKQELSQVLLSDEFFVVLDHEDRGLFTIPYTINEARLIRAVQMGYPAGECNRLAHYYPKGQIFLSESSFRQGIRNADCSYGESIKQACHHFQTMVEEQNFSFAPETWEEQGIFLLIKKGRRTSIAELAKDSQRWSLWTEEKERARQTLIKICEEAQKTMRESVLTRKEWEGCIVIYGNAKTDEQEAVLVLPAGTGIIHKGLDDQAR